MSIKFLLNGEEKIINQPISLAQLIVDLKLDVKKIAVEKDLEIVMPDFFEQIMIAENSRIEIVHFIGGG
jgi:thiamine biosynthesis protein ThiS